MNKKSDIAIKYNNSRIFFSTIVIFAAAISILILTMSSSSLFFVFAVDMPPQSPSPSPPATTTEKPSTPPPSTTTTTPPNLPKIEEKKDPKDGDTILSSTTTNPDNDVSVATKVDKNSNTKTLDFNRGYVTGFTAALDPGLSKVFKRQIINIHILFQGYPEEFKNGFRLGYLSALDYLDTFELLGKSGGNPPPKK